MRKVKSRSQKSWSLFVWPHHIIRYADANYVNSVVTTYRCAIQTQDIPGQKSIIHTSLLHEYTIYIHICVCVLFDLCWTMHFFLTRTSWSHQPCGHRQWRALLLRLVAASVATPASSSSVFQPPIWGWMLFETTNENEPWMFHPSKAPSCL